MSVGEIVDNGAEDAGLIAGGTADSLGVEVVAGVDNGAVEAGLATAGAADNLGPKVVPVCTLMGAAEAGLTVTGTAVTWVTTDAETASDTTVIAAVVAAVEAIIVALDLSASATFSAVNCGTAGMGGCGLPKVTIFGCALTCTGTGAVAMIAVAL